MTVDSVVRTNISGSEEIKSRPNFVVRVELVTVKFSAVVVVLLPN